MDGRSMSRIHFDTDDGLVSTARAKSVGVE